MTHPIIPTAFNAVDSGCSIATVTSGTFKDQIACILVEFADGECICDMGGDKPMQVINIEHMNLWREAESISFIDGIKHVKWKEGVKVVDESTPTVIPQKIQELDQAHLGLIKELQDKIFHCLKSGHEADLCDLTKAYVDLLNVTPSRMLLNNVPIKLLQQ